MRKGGIADTVVNCALAGLLFVNAVYVAPTLPRLIKSQRSKATAEYRNNQPENPITRVIRSHGASIEDVVEQAMSLEDHRKAYLIQPNKDYSFVMSDAEFYDRDFVSEKQIQHYLDNKGSILAKKHKGILFSKEAYAAAHHYHINPLVLLATVQKEQGLVSRKAFKDTKTQAKVLSRCMGYGCFDDGTDLKSGASYRAQIWGAARTLRKRADEFTATSRVRLNGSRKPHYHAKNRATHALARYTPHTSGLRLMSSVYRSMRSKLRS